MLRLIIVVFVLLVVYRIVRARGLRNSRKRFNDLIDESGTQLYTDPVCGKEVARSDAYLLWENGKAYGFCSEECMHKFKYAEEWKM